MSSQIAQEDVDRIRQIMHAVVVRDDKKLSTLIDDNREIMEKVWELIDSLYLQIATPDV